jgi:cellulose synthase/poly-beta-1,6-N-acetylglucosamine synthase-like glycosyltransferase
MSEAKNNLYPCISIIVPTKNNENCIENCMKSLVNLEYPKERYEITVVDGHSKDRTVEIAQRYGARVIEQQGKGYNGAWNNGIQLAEGEYIAFTDADCTVDRNWLKSSLRYFQHDKVAAVGGPNLVPDYANPFTRAIEFVSLQSPYASKFETETEVEFLAGCNCIYKASLVRHFFPLPEMSGSGDTLLSYRIREAGLKLLSAPDAIVWHNRHYSTVKSFFKKMVYNGKDEVQLSRFRGMSKPLHKLEGFSLPILLSLAIILYFISKPALLAGIGLAITLLLFFSMKCLWQTRSLAIARYVPLVIIIEALGYSLGYLREKFGPNPNPDEQARKG